MIDHLLEWTQSKKTTLAIKRRHQWKHTLVLYNALTVHSKYPIKNPIKTFAEWLHLRQKCAEINLASFYTLHYQ